MRTQSLLSFFFAAISLTLPAFGAKNANRKERPEKPAEKLPSASHRNASSKKTQPPTVQGQPSKQTVSPPREFAENEEKAETPVLENAATFEPQQPTQYDELIAEKVAPSEASLGERQQEIFDSPTFKQQTPAGNAQEEMEAQPNIAMPVKSSSRAHIPLRKRGSSFSGGPFDPQPKLQRRRSVDDLQSYVQLSRQPLRNEAIDKEAPSQPASNGSKSPNAGQKDGSSWGWWVAGGLGLLGLFGAGYYVHSKYRRS